MDTAFFRLFYRFNFFYAVHGLAAGRGLILWAMNEKKLRKKANLWIATAANELNEIRRRWHLTSNRQFARAVGMNERTIAKLNPKQPDSSLSLETVDRIYSALIALRCVYITDEEMEEEYRPADGVEDTHRYERSPAATGRKGRCSRRTPKSREADRKMLKRTRPNRCADGDKAGGEAVVQKV